MPWKIPAYRLSQEKQAHRFTYDGDMSVAISAEKPEPA